MSRTYVLLAAAGVLALWLIAWSPFGATRGPRGSRPAERSSRDQAAAAQPAVDRGARSALGQRAAPARADTPSRTSASYARAEAGPTASASALLAPAPAAAGFVTPGANAPSELAAAPLLTARTAASSAADTPSAATGGTDPSAGERRSPLEQQWHAQPHDPARSREMHAYLKHTAEALSLPDKVVKKADCGSSVCRVQLAFDKVEEALAFEQAAQSPDLRYEVKQTKAPLLEMPEGLGGASEPQPGAAVDGAAPQSGSASPSQATPLDEPPTGMPPFEVEAMLELGAVKTE